MKYRQQADTDAFGRVQKFLDGNPDQFAAINASADRATLDDVVNQIQAQGLAQWLGRTGAKAQTFKLRAMCVSLRLNQMTPICTLARVRIPGVPAATALTVPDCRASVPKLVATAAAMANTVEPYLQTLVSAGLQPNCIDQLRASIDAINAALTERSSNRLQWIAATAGIKAQIARGRQALMVLDAVVVSQCQGNANLLASWRQAKRVPDKPGPSRDAAGEP
jgi:hypothetical protein